MKRFLIPILLPSVLALGAFVPAGAKGDKDDAPFIGIYPGEVTSDIAADYGVTAGGGVLVEGVVPGTPAAEVGLRENDVITRLNDVPLTGPAELGVQLKKFKPGDVVTITYLRGGQQKTASVKLAEQDDHDPAARFWGDPGCRIRFGEGAPWMWLQKDKPKKKRAFAGIVTQSLRDGLADYFKVKKGALISEVVENSAAEKAGLKAGDVITRIGNETIEDEGDVAQAIRSHDPGDKVDFVVVREGREMTITLTLGEKEYWGELNIPDVKVMLDDKALTLPTEEELEKLSEELRKMEIRIDANQLPIPSGRTYSTVTISTSSSDPWQASFARLRDSLKETFTVLRQQLNVLRQQLEELAQRLRSAMA